MRPAPVSLLTALLLCCLAQVAQAVAGPGGTAGPTDVDRPAAEIVLTLTGTSVGAEYVTLDFSIPYAGLVEFHLYDPKKGKIWNTSAVMAKPGSHNLVFSRSALREGETYFFEFKYKGKSTGGAFKNA